ncbi:hypothetical protein [Candidatus Aalborgicola defluviihabitans]|jgi:hypothetical protein|uniref:hypothetical protein n=1 Tax=Candidatus Aalborgicola defluviihabitans TaxID=3386187 RepID=UPI001EC4E895|nr:hypothetical protein [Burkholderiales bacterium]MBK7282568.1 hypothetical protein [Burkholderiales bacterium]
MAKIMPNPPAIPISMATAPFLIKRFEFWYFTLSPVVMVEVLPPTETQDFLRYCVESQTVMTARAVPS